MKRHIQIFLIGLAVITVILLLIGCKSKDSSVKSKYKAETEIKNDIYENHVSISDSQSTESIKDSEISNIDIQTNENTSIIQNIVEYDTDKPIDPNTGKHPVKKETTNYINSNKEQKENSQSEKNSDQSKSENSNKKDISSIVDNSALTKKEESEVSIKEEKSLTLYQEACIWFTSLVLVALALYLGIKYRGNIFSFFRKLIFKA